MHAAGVLSTCMRAWLSHIEEKEEGEEEEEEEEGMVVTGARVHAPSGPTVGQGH